jgi:putative chitinase
MGLEITEDMLDEIMDNIEDSAEWAAALNKVLPHFNVNNPKRVAMFLAQTGHESGDFRTLHENLNYKAEGLVKIFHKYFPDAETAAEYAHNPEKIANRVYSSRMGNGDEESGDGYKYRGRGLIQLTGKDNYKKCSEAVYGDDRLLENPEVLEDKEGAIASACWFWTSRHLNEWSDQGNIAEVTKRINGGTIGLEDRTERYETALALLEA